jgi:hypothetical protein
VVRGPIRISGAMSWNVRYRKDAMDHFDGHPSPEQAIEAACHLIDDGCDVYGIDTESLTDPIGRDMITRIHGIWAREKSGFGRE